MPLGDTAIASANATEPISVTPETGATGSQEAQADAAPAAPGADASGEADAPAEGEAATPAPETSEPAETEQAPKAPEKPAATPAKPKAAAPRAAESGYGLKWTVADRAGKPVAGTSVKLEGPGVKQWWEAFRWDASYRVTDCTSAPCAPTSMDQDPAPGAFYVDRLVSGTKITHFDRTVTQQRFRLQPETAPAGMAWSMGDNWEIPGRDATPTPNPWGAQAWDFGTLTLVQTQMSCAVGDIYSISATGQLELLSALGDSAGIAKIGAPAANVTRFNGLGMGATPTQQIYAFNRFGESASAGAQIYTFDPRQGSWKVVPGAQFNSNTTDDKTNAYVGGAVDPGGAYWVGGYNSDGTQFYLRKLEAGGNVVKHSGRVTLPKPGILGSGINGDLAFDNAGNLYLVRGKGNRLEVFMVTKAQLAQAGNNGVISGATRVLLSDQSIASVNGIAYDASGRLYVASTDNFAYLGRDASGAVQAPVGLGLPGGSLSTTDLATCSFPPTVTIQKRLPDGRAYPTDQFELSLRIGHGQVETQTTTGTASGLQEKAVGPIPVPIGSSLAFTEKPGNPTTKLENYVTSWECKLDNKVLWGEESLGKEFIMPESAAGKEVRCTITNALMKVTKQADIKHGTSVSENQVITYTLTFDNSKGATPATVDYRDYLADVLDDATFYDPKTRERVAAPVIEASAGVTSRWDAKNEWVTFTGSVRAGSVAKVTIPVQVRANTDSSTARGEASATDGFFLRNKLARGTEPVPPEECSPGMCVEHPINAWTVKKDSLPANGARLHKGGNVHYKVTAEKANLGTNLSGLVLTDDLTHVLKSAGWAPQAAVPAGAVKRGVYLFNEDNRTIGLDGRPNTEDPEHLASIRDVAAPQRVNVAKPGAAEDLRWIVTSGAPINMPAEAVRAEMWFAVQAAESPAQTPIPDPSIWVGQGKAPSSGWKFANYATGIAKTGTGSGAKDFAPNECVTGKHVPDTSLAPNAEVPSDLGFPDRCRVQHEISENYFTIRKDAAGAGVQHLADDPSWDPDPTGLWNMVGHEFEVRDHDAATGGPTSYPSVQLCRTDYDPYAGWRGEWVSPERAADSSLWAFGTEGAAIQQRITDWNNDHPPVGAAKPVPMCGTIYAIPSGAQKGRWRSENLDAGDYWLVETKAPTAQAAVNATSKAPRQVDGVQRLAQPVPFKIWPETDGPAEGSAMQGRGQLDVGDGSGGYVPRCDPGTQEGGTFVPGGTIAERKPACVNPTGYLMLVKDPVPVPLPLTGGNWLPAVIGGGAVVLIAALAGAVWWRRRAITPSAGRHGA